jgi:hypothetical protein
VQVPFALLMWAFFTHRYLKKKKLRGGDGDVSFRFASLTLSLAAAEMNAFITPASP